MSRFFMVQCVLAHWATIWTVCGSWSLGSQPAGDINHKPRGTLPLLSTRSMVTFYLLSCTASLPLG